MKAINDKELEKIEEQLISGSIVVLGEQWLKQSKWKGPKAIVLQTFYFDSGGDFSGCDEAPGYLRNDDPTDPDSIYHLFGNDLEYWYDCQVFETPEAYAKHYTAETLAELDRVKSELKGFKRAEEHQRKNAVKALLDLGKAQAERDELREEKNEFTRALKDCIDVLEQVRAERDELKAALKLFQDYPDDFSKEAPKDKFTMTVFCSDIAKAQQLLKAK